MVWKRHQPRDNHKSVVVILALIKPAIHDSQSTVPASANNQHNNIYQYFTTVMYITEPQDTTAFPQLSYSENKQRSSDWLGNQSLISNKSKSD